MFFKGRIKVHFGGVLYQCKILHVYIYMYGMVCVVNDTWFQ